MINYIFGGFIIYKLCVLLYRKMLNAYDPDARDEVSTL